MEVTSANNFKLDQGHTIISSSRSQDLVDSDGVEYDCLSESLQFKKHYESGTKDETINIKLRDSSNTFSKN